MAAGYETFKEAYAVAQRLANKTQAKVPIFRCETARRFKWTAGYSRYGTKLVHFAKPE